MKKTNGRRNLLLMGKRGALLLLALIMSVASVLNTLQPQKTSAAQLTPRKVTISTSESAKTGVSYTYTFRISSSIDVEGIIFEYCTTPLGTCTKPSGLDVTAATASVSATQTFTGGTAFAEVASTTGDCVLTGNATTETKYCVNRTDATNEATGVDKVITLNGITNPTISDNFLTVFVRMSLYDNNGFVSTGGVGSQIVHYGTVAAAIVKQLTTTGRVQERLEFCVAAVDEATWDTSYPADCTDNAGVDAWPTTTSVDMGIIDDVTVVIAPVNNTTTNPANDSFGIAMLDTNASNGAVITYFPEAATNVSGGDTDQLRSFRVLPTNCDALSTSLTDQCFKSAGATAVAMSAGSELFGLYVACLITSTGTTGGNLNVPDDYDGDDDDVTEASDCENEAPVSAYEVAFRDDGTAAALASSTTVVDDEMIVIRFAATAQSTTPTGQYTVVTTYVATPTY